MQALSSMASFSDAHECNAIPVIAANVTRAILPAQSRTARAASALIPAWVRLTAAMTDQLLAIGAGLWDEFGI